MNVQEQRVTAVALFTLCPNHEQVWLMVWEDLAAVACRMPQCRWFRLLADLGDHTHCAALSEWDNREALATFWRENGINWLGDALGYEHSPVKMLVFGATTGRSWGVGKPATDVRCSCEWSRKDDASP